MFFIEQSTFWQDAQGDATIETYYGGKICVRHCTGTNLFIGIHGNDSGVRTGHAIEWYENVIDVDIGAYFISAVTSRGGTGVVYNNTYTDAGSGYNFINLQHYRSIGNANADITTRFPYETGQSDGSYAYDGNTAVNNGSGTHTGSNGATDLTDSTKSWTTLAGEGDFTLTNTLQSLFLWNRTKKVGGRIVANTATTATVDRMVYAQIEDDPASPTSATSFIVHSGQSALFPATPFNVRTWKPGTDSSTSGQYEIMTVTGISGKTLTVTRAQSGTSALALDKLFFLSVESGARLTWDTGDSYVITAGYPALDQNGWAGPTRFFDTYSTQTLTPWYQWGNTWNALTGANAIPFSVDTDNASINKPDAEYFIQENREFYNDTVMPGYTAYTYPHPLAGVSDTTNPTLFSATISSNGTTLTLVYSESVTGVAAADYSLNSGSLSSASGSGATWTMTISPTVYSGAVRTISYAPGGTIDASSNALASFSGTSVTNNSTQNDPSGNTNRGKSRSKVSKALMSK